MRAAVQARARETLVVRPGLIIGPGDPSGRFSYWPERLAEGGDVLAPESPDRDTQAIDVRDLAAWIVTCAEQGLTGVYDATGPILRLGTMVDEVVSAVGGNAQPGVGICRLPAGAGRWRTGPALVRFPSGCRRRAAG